MKVFLYKIVMLLFNIMLNYESTQTMETQTIRGLDEDMTCPARSNNRTHAYCDMCECCVFCAECVCEESEGEMSEDEKSEVQESEIVFKCFHCDTAIVRNSREHDNCITVDGEEWFCVHCLDFCPNFSPNVDEEVEEKEQSKPTEIFCNTQLPNPDDVVSIIEPTDYKSINVDNIVELPTDYPEEFKQYCIDNELKPPNITTSNGKALSVMLLYKFHYWNRETCDKFVEKFNISTKDSIQLFNKHTQWGIQTNSGTERGKLYILYPYCLSNKHKMRKNFKFDGSETEKNAEIDKIKSTIKTDYVDIPNNLWQLGHKNPASTDNTTDNLVLQPPIQGKYRDNYIFIDTLTKIPVPNKLEIMIDKKEIEFSKEQIENYKRIFDKLFASI